jgi:hypothetical protein
MKKLILGLSAICLLATVACKKEVNEVLAGNYSVSQSCGGASGDFTSTIEKHADADSVYINVVYGSNTYKTVAWFYYTNFTVKAPLQTINGATIEGEGNYLSQKGIMNFNYTLTDSNGLHYCGGIWTKQ